MNVNRWRISVLAILIIFLTFSAWLVSLFGNIWLSLGRDILLAIFVILSLCQWRKTRRPDILVYFIVGFIAVTLLSYFAKSDSLGQWLRGARYLLEPFIVLLTLKIFPLEGSKDLLTKTLLWSIFIVLIGALADYLFPNFLSFSLQASQSGSLSQVHLAGTAFRLQSILAGPNALGLYSMLAILLYPIWKNIMPGRSALILLFLLIISLALTYSRSSYIGLLAGIFVLLIAAGSQIKNSRLLLTLLLTVVLFGAVAVIITRPADLIRTQSNTARISQYVRIYNERNQIGYLGRGAGTAGLVSEYAFDGTPNYHSENSYLDVYENIGPLGALLYLGIWVLLIYQLLRKPEFKSKVIATAVLGLIIAGIFIDHYTGQIAIWTTLIFAGIVY